MLVSWRLNPANQAKGSQGDLSGEVEKEGDVCNFEPHEVVEIWQSPVPRPELCRLRGELREAIEFSMA